MTRVSWQLGFRLWYRHRSGTGTGTVCTMCSLASVPQSGTQMSNEYGDVKRKIINFSF